MSGHPSSIAGADSVSRTWRLCLKELRESLRDRRTLITLVLMPLIVYPLLSIVFQRLVLTGASQDRLDIVIGIDDDAAENELRALARHDPSSFETIPLNEHEQRILGAPKINYTQVENISEAVRDGHVDIGFGLSAGHVKEPSSGQRYDIVFDPSNLRARVGASLLERQLWKVREASLGNQLAQLGESTIAPFEINEQRIYPESNATQSLATLIPLILVLMTVTGAVYPAIDLTAGERERGTMEALIAAPIPRLGLLFAKYVAVMVVAILTATANLIAMSVTLYTSGLVEALLGTQSLSLTAIAAIFALMVLFASFFSAVLLAVTSFARSFKEAQAYIIPLILVALAPSMLCLLPGIQLTPWLAVTPLVNIVMLARDIFSGESGWQLVPLVIISTGIYAAAAISVAARVFGSDAILYGSDTGFKQLFLGRGTGGGVPSLAGSNLYLALLFPLYIWLASSLSFLSQWNLAWRLLASSSISIVLFAALPWIIARSVRLRLVKTFRWHVPRWSSLFAVILLGLSLWPLLHEMMVWSQGEFAGLPPTGIQLIEQFVEQLRQLPTWFVLLTMAVLPALCEELFFRGFLFSSFLARMSARQSILLSSILFGVFHVVAKETLAVERMLPSTLMGMVLGWVAWRTRSVFPGMILHATHNGLLTLVIVFQPQIEARGWGVSQSAHLPVYLLAAAAVGVLLGMWMIAALSTRPEKAS